MSVRAMIQVPDTLKADIEGAKETFRSKTNYEVIEKLLKYYNDNEEQKEKDRVSRLKELQNQKLTMLNVGSGMKDSFIQLSNALGLKDESLMLEFLLEHYHSSDSVSKRLFEWLQLKRLGERA